MKIYLPLVILLASLNFINAANFSSTQNGAFNDPATWGNIGAPVPGLNYPGEFDNVTIAHTVTLNLTSDVKISSLTASWTTGVLNVTNAGTFALDITNNVLFQGGGTSLSIGDNTSFNVGGNLSIEQSAMTIGTNADLIVTGNVILDASSVQINNGTVLTVNGSTDSKNGGNLTVKNGGSVVLNGNYNFSGGSSTVTVEQTGTIDINGTLTINSGPNYFNISGEITTDSLNATNGEQRLNIEPTGNFKVIHGANFSGGAAFDVQNSGYFRIGGNLTVATGGTQSNVDGNLLVGGTISVTGAPILGSGNIQGELTSGVALPIELNYFKASTHKSIVTLNWQTTTELNNDYFTLERSKDGINYEIIGTILGAGTSLTTINYSFTDNNPLNGVSYYRLKQTDYDGKFEVFSPVSISYLNEFEIKIGSNSSAKEFNISLNGEVGLGIAKIYNIVGVLVKTVEIKDSYTTINASDLPNGNYILVISANKTQISKKIMVR